MLKNSHLDKHNVLILVPEGASFPMYRTKSLFDQIESGVLYNNFTNYREEIHQYTSYQFNRPDYVYVDNIYIKGLDYTAEDIFEEECFTKLNDSHTPLEIFVIGQTKEFQVRLYKYVCSNDNRRIIVHLDALGGDEEPIDSVFLIDRISQPNRHAKQPSVEEKIKEVEAVSASTTNALSAVKAAALLDQKTFHLTHIRNNYRASIDDLESEIGAMNGLLLRIKTVGK